MTNLNKYITKGIKDSNNYSYNNNTILDYNATSFPQKNFKTKVEEFLGEQACLYIKFLSKLKKFDENEYNKVVACESEELMLVCKNGLHRMKVLNRCNSKYCLFCNKRKRIKNRGILNEFLNNNESNIPLRFLTLTWKNTDYLSIKLKKKYTRDFNLLKRRLKKYGYFFEKGVKVLEVNYNVSYNYHLHILFYGYFKPSVNNLKNLKRRCSLPIKIRRKGIIERKKISYRKVFTVDGRIDVDFLRDEWEQITGDSFILKLERIKYGTEGGVSYVSKYVTKLQDFFKLSYMKLIEYDNFMKNMRIYEKFGFKDSFSNYKKVYLCPICRVKMEIDYQYYQEEYSLDEVEELYPEYIINMEEK